MPPFALVDAFTDRPFAGNPAGVVLLDEPADERWMADLAAEVGASETAFLVPSDDAWQLRWFTPTVEVDLCGHATLAAAHVLWSRDVAVTELRFATRSGILTATRDADGTSWLDLPAWPVELRDEAPTGLAGALRGSSTPTSDGRAVPSRTTSPRCPTRPPCC